MRGLALVVLRVLEVALSIVAVVSSLPVLGVVALRDLLERSR